MTGELLIPRDRLHAMYVASFEELNIKKETLATLAGQGVYSVSTVNSIQAKIKGRKGKMPTKADVSWLKALVALKRLGFDIAKITFDENGDIVLAR